MVQLLKCPSVLGKKGIQALLCWHLPTVLWECPVPCPTGCWDGGRGKHLGLPCLSLSVGYKTLKYSLVYKIWINLKPFYHFPQLRVPCMPEKIPKSVNPHGKQRFNVHISRQQHTVRDSLCGEGMMLSLDYCSCCRMSLALRCLLFYLSLGITLSSWVLEAWKSESPVLYGAGAIEQWVLKGILLPGRIWETAKIWEPEDDWIDWGQWEPKLQCSMCVVMFEGQEKPPALLGATQLYRRGHREFFLRVPSSTEFRSWV